MQKLAQQLTSNRGNMITFKYVYLEKNDPIVMLQLIDALRYLEIIPEEKAMIYMKFWANASRIEQNIHKEFKSLLSSKEVL